MLRGFCLGRPLHAAEAGGGSTTTNAAAQTSAGEGKNTAAPEGQRPAAASSGAPEKTFTQADLDRIVGERLAEETRKQEAKATKAAEAARAAALKDQGDYKKVAEQHEARLAELEPYKARVEAYEQRLSAEIEAEIKDWPAEVKAFDPGAENMQARLDWRDKARPLAAQLAKKPTPPDTDMGRRSERTASAQPAHPTAFRFQAAGDVKW